VFANLLDRQTDTFWLPEDAGSVATFWSLAVAVFFSMLLKKAVSCQDYKLSVIDELMNVEYWWNNADRGRQKYSIYKPSLLPLCPQQISDGPLRLEIVGAMAQPCDCGLSSAEQ